MNPFTQGGRRIRLVLTSLVAAMLVVVGLPSVAGAHHPEIVGDVDCDFVIRYTATAWVGTGIADSRHNNMVTITVDGVPVDTGQFTDGNNYTFSGQFQATPGTTYTIRATADVAWGVNETRGAPGTWRETTVTVPTPCVPPSTTPSTSTTAPTTSAPPSTSASPSTPTTPTTTAAAGNPTTTTVPTEVAGELEVAQPAQPVPAQPTFTG